ncbi:hypothetical protein SDJN03_30364, partial [Cucurbita argyrosperma subsp. sororia]
MQAYAERSLAAVRKKNLEDERMRGSQRDKERKRKRKDVKKCSRKEKEKSLENHAAESGEEQIWVSRRSPSTVAHAAAP